MCLHRISNALCAVVLLGALLVLVAPPVSAQPFGGSPTGPAVSSSDSPPIIHVLLDWLAGWSAADSEEHPTSADSETLDFNGGQSGSEDPEDDGDAGSGLDPNG